MVGRHRHDLGRRLQPPPSPAISPVPPRRLMPQLPSRSEESPWTQPTFFTPELVPGNAGLYQLNVRVPEAVPNGDQVVVITIGGFSSPANALFESDSRTLKGSGANMGVWPGHRAPPFASTPS